MLKFITITDGGTRRYLVQWKGKLPTNDTWVDRSELQYTDPDIWSSMRVLPVLNSTESIFFPIWGE